MHNQAEQIHQNHADPKPPLTISELLREQNFGIAERKPFGEDNGGYTRLSGRTFKFENGESLEDVRQRANNVYALVSWRKEDTVVLTEQDRSVYRGQSEGESGQTTYVKTYRSGSSWNLQL